VVREWFVGSVTARARRGLLGTLSYGRRYALVADDMNAFKRQCDIPAAIYANVDLDVAPIARIRPGAYFPRSRIGRLVLRRSHYDYGAKSNLYWSTGCGQHRHLPLRYVHRRRDIYRDLLVERVEHKG